MNMTNKAARLVFNAGVARRLIKAGCTLIDIKPDKNNKDKTVFVFKNDDMFQTEFDKINIEIAENKQQRDDETL